MLIRTFHTSELENGKVLLRLAHLYETGDDRDYSVMEKVELKKLFPGKKAIEMLLFLNIYLSKMNLSANQERSEMEKKRLEWRVEGASEERRGLRGGAFDPTRLEVELAPSEIRTFEVEFDYIRMFGS
ncbi:unnamed protein product [Coffea canephora]|uniref:Glycosyl hydrolases family 38 C-terminal domain-containing protein n=1 Tax=Coffea canephora TaxID=49390 RepID=A0A068VAR4_COFCA|nr:unnamed protein product [Coffea canephora]